MKRFAALFEALDGSTSTVSKVTSMRDYLAQAPLGDAAWAVYFLSGGKPRRAVPTSVLRAAACEQAGIDDALFDACYQTVGDLAETIALVLPSKRSSSALGLQAWMEERLLPLRGLPPAAMAERVVAWWDELDTTERFLLTKLIGGGFRVGVSKLLVQRALAAHAGVDAKVMAQRMMGSTSSKMLPTAASLQALITGLRAMDGSGDDLLAGVATEVPSLLPYPFFLAHPIATEVGAMASVLGPTSDWQVEWKYDGIRAQAVKRGGQLGLWSRGEELVSDHFPDVVQALATLPDGCVLDGELLVWQNGAPAPFAMLQKRIMRKAPSAKWLADLPARFMAYDLLELDHADGRDIGMHERRQRLQALHASMPPSAFELSPVVLGDSWESLAALRAQSRARGVEGLMLKHGQSRYGTGRTKQDGLWYKWKIDPMTVDAVLIYAQRGHGRRAGLYTDYTFAVWSRPPVDAAEAEAVVNAIADRGGQAKADQEGLRLVPFAKAYAGLTDAQFQAVNREIRRHGLESFGPVRSVKPTMVFELGFEGIGASPRHKSGVAVRFPRMLRIRDDKPLHEADSLDTLRALMDRPTPSSGSTSPP
jgi:DNA ligase 1